MILILTLNYLRPPQNTLPWSELLRLLSILLQSIPECLPADFFHLPREDLAPQSLSPSHLGSLPLMACLQGQGYSLG